MDYKDNKYFLLSEWDYSKGATDFKVRPLDSLETELSLGSSFQENGNTYTLMHAYVTISKDYLVPMKENSESASCKDHIEKQFLGNQS